MADKSTDRDYGKQLLEEVRGRGVLHVLTNRFGYDELQQLKQADRAETLALFQGDAFSVIQAIKTKSASEVADMFEQSENDKSKMPPPMFFFCF